MSQLNNSRGRFGGRGRGNVRSNGRGDQRDRGRFGDARLINPIASNLQVMWMMKKISCLTSIQIESKQ